MNHYSWSFSQDFDANERDNSKEFFVAVKYEADLEVRSDFFCPELFFILFSYVVPKDLQIQANIRRIFLRKYVQNKNISHPHLITRCRKLTGIFTLNKKTTQIFIWWWSIELLIDCCTFFTYVGFVMVFALSAQI